MSTTFVPMPAVPSSDPSVDHAIQAIVGGVSTDATCTTDLAVGPWDFDTRPGYGPGSSMGDVIPTGAPRQGELPAAYREAGAAELHRRIEAAKAALGDRVVILGHFYQREEVVTHADEVGDSFQLATAATMRPDAEAIVFCGVHFMAETADLLSRPDQAVILPNLAAGCSMADMADIDQVEACWEQLADVLGDLDTPDADGRVPVIPVTYMNSSAAIKGFVGRHGGIVCTSSNAATVLEWAFARGRRVLFFPDQHLGRNTAKAMGVPLDRMPMWNPRRALGGSTAEELVDAQVIPWHGFCSVHRRSPVAHEAGSAEYTRRAIAEAAEPSTVAVGTEINLVRRLAAQYPQHRIFCLDPVVCPCSTMYRIHPGYLAWVLEELVAGRTPNRITVSPDVADPARLALERMLAAKPPVAAGAR